MLDGGGLSFAEVCSRGGCRWDQLLYADGEPQTAGGAYAVSVLTAEEAAAREPGLKTKDGRWHLYPDEGRADPAATHALGGGPPWHSSRRWW